VTYLRDAFHSHTGAVDTLTAAGIAPPREWTALRDRFNAFLATQHPCLARLAAGGVTPTGADVDVLRALALAEQTASHDEVTVTAAVRAPVHTKLVRLYEADAKKNYRAVADRFDKAADVITKAAKVIDPKTFVWNLYPMTRQVT
jgi:hypothetical protein